MWEVGWALVLGLAFVLALHWLAQRVLGWALPELWLRHEQWWPFAALVCLAVGVSTLLWMRTGNPLVDVLVGGYFVAFGFFIVVMNVRRMRSRVAVARKNGNVAELLEILRSGPRRERADAANALAHLGVDGARRGEVDRELLTAARDADVDVRGQALFAIAERRVAAAEPLLFEALQDKEWSVRLFAIHALASMHVRAAGKRVMQMLSDDDWWLVRQQAAYALADLRPGGAEQALMTAAESDRDDEVRKAARESLDRLREVAVVDEGQA